MPFGIIFEVWKGMVTPDVSTKCMTGWGDQCAS